MIYSHSEQSMYTGWDRHDAILIKAVIKLGSQRNETSGVNEKQKVCKLKLEIDYQI